MLEYGGLSEGFRRIIVGFDSTARAGSREGLGGRESLAVGVGKKGKVEGGNIVLEVHLPRGSFYAYLDGVLQCFLWFSFDQNLGFSWICLHNTRLFADGSCMVLGVNSCSMLF